MKNLNITYKTFFATVTALFLALFLTACEQGTAEEAGENIDNAAEEMKDKMENATTDAGNAVEDACEDVEQAAGADDTDC